MTESGRKGTSGTLVGRCRLQDLSHSARSGPRTRSVMKSNRPGQDGRSSAGPAACADSLTGESGLGEWSRHCQREGHCSSTLSLPNEPQAREDRMRLAMMARSRMSLVPLLTTVATASLLLAGCAGDATSRSAAQPKTLSAMRTSPIVPTDAQRALVGVADGTYTYEIDPNQAESLTFGASHLDIPANAVCDLATSSYGVGTWNDSCEPQTQPFTITAVVRNAATDHPSVEFQPALRFNPQSNVNLYLYVTDQATLDNTKRSEERRVGKECKSRWWR